MTTTDNANKLHITITGRPVDHDKIQKVVTFSCFSCRYTASEKGWKFLPSMPMQIQVKTCPKCGTRMIFHPVERES